MEELGNSEAAVASCNISRDDTGTVVVVLSGELDLSNADSVREALDELIRQRPPTITFDLTDLRFVDSSGIAILLTVAEAGSAVELIGVTPVVRRVIQLTGIDHVLRLVE